MARQIGEAFVTVSLQPDRDTGALQGIKRDLDGVGDTAGKAERKIDHLGDEVSIVGRQFVVMAAEAKLAARAIDDIGDEASTAGRKLGTMGAGGMFASIAPAATKAGAESAGTFASAFQGGILSAFKSLPAPAQAALVAGLLTAATVAAPAIATAVSGAIIAGVGAAGLGAGIALAFRSADVQAAFKGLGDDLLTQLTSAAKPFEGELVSAAGVIGSAFATMMPDIRASFGALATTVGPIVEGLTGLATNAMPGIRAAAAAAAPMFKAIGAELPGIGTALASLLKDVAEVGPQATELFTGMIHGLEIGLIGLGDWLNMMGKILGGAQLVGAALTSWIPGMGDTSGVLGHLVGEMHAVAGAAQEATGGAAGLRQGLDDLFGVTMSVDQATLRWHESLAALTAELKDGARTLDENSAAGRKNVGALLSAVDAAERVREADIAAGVSVAEATSKFNASIDTIIAAAQAAGFNAQQIDALIGKYKQVPRDVNTNLNLYGLEAELRGIAQAGQALASLNGKTATTYVRVVQQGNMPGNFNADGNIYAPVQRFAAGGENHFAQISNSMRVWGEPETGGEAYIPLARSKRPRSLALLSKVANGFGFGLTRGEEGSRTAELVGVLIEEVRQLRAVTGRLGADFGAVMNGTAARTRQLGRTR